jgi:Gluconate 2-dehydrogenase subunit 3
MERRDILKLLASATVLPALGSDALFWFEGVHSQIAKASALKTLTPDQDATVTTIAELIIPQTDTPGAKAAKVNEFIDVILSDWYDEPTTARFLAGLADVDKRSQKSFGKKFVACSEVDQKKLLTLLDKESMAPARKADAAGQKKRQPVVDQQSLSAKKEEIPAGPPAAYAPANFFAMIKKLTLVGYYTSEAGFKDELHKQIIPPTHKGCAPLTGAA